MATRTAETPPTSSLAALREEPNLVGKCDLSMTKLKPNGSLPITCDCYCCTFAGEGVPLRGDGRLRGPRPPLRRRRRLRRRIRRAHAAVRHRRRQRDHRDVTYMTFAEIWILSCYPDLGVTWIRYPIQLTKPTLLPLSYLSYQHTPSKCGRLITIVPYRRLRALNRRQRRRRQRQSRRGRRHRRTARRSDHRGRRFHPQQEQVGRGPEQSDAGGRVSATTG